MSDSREFPGFDRIFYLREPGGSRAFRVDASVQSMAEVVERARAESSPTRLVASWRMGETIPRDFIFSTIGITLISDRVVELFASQRFTGWTTYPVELRGKHADLIEGYHGLAVSGRCGEIDDTRSVRFDKMLPGGVFPWWRGYYFDERSWDGSDIFMPTERSLLVFLVERVRRALNRAKVRNLDLVALDQMERIPIPNTGNPARLT